MNAFTFNLENIAEIAQKLTPYVSVGTPLMMNGEMGAGKTTLSAALIKAMGCDAIVTSPTFNIMQQYNIKNSTLWHCDLYRLETTGDIIELGLFELIYENYMIIEWSERLAELTPKKRTEFNIEIINNNTRNLTIRQFD